MQRGQTALSRQLNHRFIRELALRFEGPKTRAGARERADIDRLATAGLAERERLEPWQLSCDEPDDVIIGEPALDGDTSLRCVGL